MRPTATSPKSPEWYQLETTKNCPAKNLKIKIATRMDKPQNMKHCGSVYFLALLAITAAAGGILHLEKVDKIEFHRPMYFLKGLKSVVSL